MRRLALPAARLLASAPEGGGAPVPKHLLPVPGNAVAVPRRHFDPREGWFRRIERQANRFLSRRIFPHVPGIRYPYTFILDRHLECSEAEVSLDGLGRELDGASILLVSDIHAGPFLDPEALGRALGRAAATHPDLILLGGDFATTRLGELEPCLPAFSRLRAPLGVWAVLGNHDHYTEDAHRIREMLEAAGIRVLHNDAACIERDGSKVVLVGIDDLHWGRVDLEGALESGRKLATDCPVILLSHNPDVFFSAAKMGVGLVLAGHTHGGQIRLPRLPVLVRMSRYRLDSGRYRWGKSELVVSRGLGASGLPLRIGCPPEVVRLILRSGTGTPGGGPRSPFPRRTDGGRSVSGAE